MSVSLRILQHIVDEYQAGTIRDLVFEIQYRLGVGQVAAQQLASVIKEREIALATREQGGPMSEEEGEEFDALYPVTLPNTGRG